MSLPIPPSVDIAKSQAKRLRSLMANKGIKLSNSEALEALAGTYGLVDWNTLHAMVSKPQKLYLAYCHLDAKETKGKEPRSSYFSYLLQAESVNELMETCEREFRKLPTNGNPFNKGDKITIESVVEIDPIPKNGVVLDYKSFEGDHGFIQSLSPVAGESDGVNSYQVGEEDSNGDWIFPEPLVVLGRK